MPTSPESIIARYGVLVIGCTLLRNCGRYPARDKEKTCLENPFIIPCKLASNPLNANAVNTTITTLSLGCTLRSILVSGESVFKKLFKVMEERHVAINKGEDDSVAVPGNLR